MLISGTESFSRLSKLDLHLLPFIFNERRGGSAFLRSASIAPTLLVRDSSGMQEIKHCAKARKLM